MTLRLHLGCGKRYIPGFVHIDLADYPHIDHRAGVDRLPMIADRSCELVYASHVLEYFDRFEAEAVLAEWRRVLEPGGILRVAVPDFPALVEVYRRTGEIERILGPLYGRMAIGEGPGRSTVVYHKTAYDFESLRDLLERCGFRDVRRYDWRETIHKDHDDFSQAYFPHMEKEKGLLISLNVEARAAK